MIKTPNQEKRKEKFEKNLKKYVKAKELEFSFEVKKEKEKVPEIEEIKETIAKGEDVVELYVRTGKYAEAKQLRTSLQQARYEIEMLDWVMNLDFNRPKPKAKELAMEMGIDLTDPVVISEFQKLQRNRLQEMKDIRDGKKVKESKPEVPKEDFNDIFRESNRAVFDNIIQSKNEDSSIENKKEQENENLLYENIEDANEEAKEGEPIQRPSRANTENNNLEQQNKRGGLDDEEEQTFSPRKIIIWAVIWLFLSSLLYIFVFRS